MKKRIICCIFTFIMTFTSLLLMTSCEEKTIVSVEALNVPKEIVLQELDEEMNNIRKAIDNSNIILDIKYDDGSVEQMHLTFNRFNQEIKEKLNSEGKHTFAYLYKGFEVSFEIEVKLYTNHKYTVCFYDLNNNLISEQKVVTGQAAIEPTEEERNVEGYAFIGWDKAFDKVTNDLDIYGIYEKLFVVTFYNGKNELIDTQYVKQNENAVSPSDEAIYLPGYVFYMWDGEFTNIQNDKAIYGVYVADYTTDTDGDGIIDYIEIEILDLDYTKVDTDDNGVTDDKEDYDGDGLLNLTEINAELNPTNPDTDGDGLIDGDEVDIYWTLPADPDTDGDGANDGWEINNGFDPLVYNSTFEVNVVTSMPDGTDIDLDIPNLPGEYVEQTIIETSTDESIADIHGSLGDAIQYNVNVTANITISSEEIKKADDPVLMHFNKESNSIETINVSVSGDKATATITTYGNYVLVDRKVFEEKGQWRDVFNKGSFTSIEIVFVIDDSGSMDSNDYYNKRLTVAKNLIDSLPDGAKIGIVRFDSDVTKLTTSLVTSKDVAKSYLNTSYFDSYGLTLMYTGAIKGLELYSTPEENDGIMRAMILISDGYPEGESNTLNSAVSKANNMGVNIYTVGLGSDTYDFERTLMPLANNTGAKYYHSNNADALKAIYEQIGEKIDMELDTDGDGIADFFESGVDQNGVPTLPVINGMDFMGLDKNDPDTDDDGYLDGQEIEIYTYYSDSKPNQVMIWGIVHSDPTDSTSVPAN